MSTRAPDAPSATPSAVSELSSPCVGVCTIDERHALCLGCGRTIEEIVAWRTLSECQRRSVMAELPARFATGSTMKSRPTLDAEGRDPQLT